MSSEIDYKMTATLDGVTTYDEEEAILARVSEWLDTPQGEVWGSPRWGNVLKQYKHSPMDSNTAGAIENSIAIKLPQDLVDVALKKVLAEPLSIDTWRITIHVSGVVIGVSREVTL